MTSEETIEGRRRSARRRGPSKVQLIYQQIVDAILAQRLPPSTRLAEEALSEIFDVSRTLIRQALLRLAHENLIELRPNRGAVVSCPGVDEARDVFRARHVIEAAIMRLAAAHADAGRLVELDAIVAHERAFFERGERGGGLRMSNDFHLMLAEIAGNKPLAKFLGELVPRSALVIALYERPGHRACSFDEHAQLIDVIRRRDVERAALLMQEHLHRCEAKLDLDRCSGETLDLRSVLAGA